jgi:hypothetical protein
VVDRLFALCFFALALAAAAAAAVICLAELIEWLQTDRWLSTSLLQVGYDWRLLKARWFLSAQWSWWIHDLLAQVPVQLALLAAAPLLWLVGKLFARR